MTLCNPKGKLRGCKAVFRPDAPYLWRVSPETRRGEGAGRAT